MGEGEEATCPMCGHAVTGTMAAERFCRTCAMLIPSDVPYYLVVRPGVLHAFCSSRCVTLFFAQDGSYCG
jgi:endogenous inhibitor of DNA gyrase (YacG/DUF329 family)